MPQPIPRPVPELQFKHDGEGNYMVCISYDGQSFVRDVDVYSLVDIRTAIIEVSSVLGVPHLVTAKWCERAYRLFIDNGGEKTR